MRVVLFVDDNGGIRFNGRRQSRDRAVVADIVASTTGPLYMTAETATLFAEFPERVCVCESPLTAAVDGTCVMETAVPDGTAASEWVVYRWNRVYPADEYARLPAERTLVSDTEFAGNSHDRITKEVWHVG